MARMFVFIVCLFSYDGCAPTTGMVKDEYPSLFIVIF